MLELPIGVDTGIGFGIDIGTNSNMYQIFMYFVDTRVQIDKG